MAHNQVRPMPKAFAHYPIPLELLAALHRASDRDVEALVAQMPETGRARLAAYCSDKGHLHRLGLRIAGTCDEATLVRVVGPDAGASLYAQSRPSAALPS
ncbi:conserved hypothetical protein [Methylobacterium sp. 4-46]|uniref:hypothetical protein n=1 Tax=unclassified Methylobacterium TaxID=2615210 RepID=UPI000152CBD0|nr:MULTISPECIES: hypothetical protein [Methylobacterium]ACA19564.1 conserved hypothetical protein [Methylobacterium sp. 4-46]WFT78759.1 hypothetical protein QA634_26360 [Methylobacterium nodulans]